MSKKYANLKNGWMLRGWTNTPYALVNWTSGEICELTAKGFYVARSCDGKIDFNSIAFLPEHQAILNFFLKKGIAKECPGGSVNEQYQNYRKAENPLVRMIHWVITGRCNLKCRHCYVEAPSGRYGELPFEDIVSFIEKFEQANVYSVAITGGEPFIRKDFLKILECLSQKKINVSQVYSNGILITPAHLSFIHELGFAPLFHISFDGCGAHDRMRGLQGCEELTIQAINTLRKNGFRVAVNTMIDKTNIDRLPDTYSLLKELGITSWRIGPPNEIGNWKGSSTALSMLEQVKALSELTRCWLTDGKPFHIKMSGFYNSSQTKSASESEFVYTMEDYDCAACRERPSLQSDGYLLPCPMYVDSVLYLKMPNLLQNDLSKVLSESILRTVADQKKKDILTYNPECAQCNFLKKCGMGCRASATHNTMNPLSRDPVVCAILKGGYMSLFHELAGV